MRLPPMMDLMLKHMQQQPIHPFALNAIRTMDVDDAIEAVRVEALDDGKQSPVRVPLRICEHDCGFARLPVSQAAGPSVPPSMAST